MKKHAIKELFERGYAQEERPENYVQRIHRARRQQTNRRRALGTIALFVCLGAGLMWSEQSQTGHTEPAAELTDTQWLLEFDATFTAYEALVADLETEANNFEEGSSFPEDTYHFFNLIDQES
ncbi:MAG: hypothetical protein ACPGQS_13365 [Bradymonadia bacterium]